MRSKKRLLTVWAIASGLLLLSPLPPRPVMSYGDTAVHLLIFVTGGAITGVMPRKWLLLLLLLAAAVITEVLQLGIVTRTFSISDMAVNLSGVVLGFVCSSVLGRILLKEK